MSEFKGTTEDLGVWQYGNDLVVSTPEGGHICVLKLAEHSDKWHEYVRANAALMSAAPEMLKALQFIQPWMPTQDSEAVYLVEKALKKALGQ